jgi:Ser-tRNA(Ala) deacylase AlaX
MACAGGIRRAARLSLRGTHVARLAELGDIVISQIKMKKGQLVVSYTLA